MAAPSTARHALALLTLLVLAAPARAQLTSGVLLRWDQCASDGGVANKTFACNTNTGSDVLAASFRLGAHDLDSDPIGGFAMNFRVTASTADVPAWWRLHSGGCHSLGLTSSATPPAGSVNCLDWAPGLGALVTGTTVQVPAVGSNSFRIQASVGAPATVQLTGGTEYFAIALNVRHTKTVGAGSCAGCDVPVCIAFENVTFERQNFPLVYASGADGEASRFVSWQSSEPQGVATNCQLLVGDRLVCATTFSCVPAATTPTRGSTWAQVKVLYR